MDPWSSRLVAAAKAASASFRRSKLASAALKPLTSFPEESLWDEINDGWCRMAFDQRKLWEAIKRRPEEWLLRDYGPCWVVAVIGETVIYYNHFEHGFNRSSWTEFGMVDSYQALQHGLEGAVQMQLDLINTGYVAGPRTSGPIVGEYPGR